MKKIIPFLIAAVLAQAGEYAVVTSKDTKLGTIGQDEVKEVFLKKRVFIKGIQLIPINLSADSGARRAFEQRVLKMDRDELSEYWINEHYRGVVPPSVQKSQASVKMFLKSIKGSMAYIDKKEVDDTLRVVYEF